MNEGQFPYSIMNDNLKNEDEYFESSIDEDDPLEFKNAMKFKPKMNDNKEKEKTSLKGAENKVRSLLSDFLKNIELEKRNENPKNAKVNFKVGNSFLRKSKKRNTVITNINIKNNNKFKIEEDNTCNNTNKKVSLFLNSNLNKNNSNTNNSAFVSSFSNNISGHKGSLKKKLILRRPSGVQFINSNQKVMKLKEKKNENNLKNMSFNKKVALSKDEKSIMKDILNITDNSINMNQKSYKKKNSSTNIKNYNKNKSNDNLNIRKDSKDRLFNNIFTKNNSKSRNLLFNDSVHNSFLSEGSECLLNQKTLEPKKVPDHKMLNISSRQSLKSNKSRPLIKKKNSMYLSKINYNNFLDNISPKGKKNRKKNRKHRNSLSSDMSEKSENSKIISNKYLKNNATFQSVREMLKETIILRPEEIENNKDKFKRKSSNKRNSVKSEKINKNEIILKSSDLIKNHLTQTTKNNEDETEQALKTKKLENSEISKKEEDNVYTNNSIRRTKTQVFEKYRNLYYKPNIYDSLDDDELEDQNDESSIYIDPNSKFAIIFDGILFFVSIIIFVETPLYLAMTQSFCRDKNFSVLFIFNIMVEVLYILDLFLGFFRAYYNWEEQLVCKHRLIINKYLQGWFLFDLIAAIPIFFLTKKSEPLCNDKELAHSYYNTVLNNIHYLIFCNKLFKVIKVHTYNQAMKFFSNKINERTKLIFSVFLAIAFLNYSACLYIFIARNSYPNWIFQTNLSMHSFQHIYICSIYILIMAITTVGYGDITCYSFNERIYQIVLLIVGILAYSFAVSAVSNFVQKLNEKSADFEKKKSILDEIRLSNPNLPEELYERILRHLKYKFIHEKKLKNLIFDCLPISLKNDLISEMYKPIIKNFIFFKNFQNKDFIVRVILSFKAIIAYKNDILVTEGDMIEDIMFVKKGVLSVELPINITDPQVNIDKYFNQPLLKMDKGKNPINNLTDLTSLNTATKKYSNMKKRSDFINSVIGWPNFESSKISNSNMKTFYSLKEKKNKEEEIRYVKILGIRNNEHFGDVLIFLEQRSPLRLRVRSKKCELFFLKKIDAINISNSHPNIWRRINKKSIYNFKQMQKCIIKIVELYCSVKRNSTISEDESLYSELLNKGKIESNQTKKLRKNNSFRSNLSPIKEIKTTQKRHSFEYENRKKYNKIIQNIDINLDDYKKNINKKKFQSSKNNNILKLESSKSNKTQLHFDSSSSSSSIEKKNKKISNEGTNGEKLIDLYYGNYKYYEGINRNLSKKKSIIAEQPSREETITLIKKKLILDNDILFQRGNSNNNMNNINMKSNKKSIFNKKDSFMSKTLKINDSYSIKFFKGDNNDLINNEDGNDDDDNDEESKMTSDERTINREINPGEEIIMNQYNCYQNKEINKDVKNLEFKNSKLHLLLNSLIKDDDKSLIDEESIDKNINIGNKINNDKKSFNSNINLNLSNYIVPNIKILSSINSESQSNDKFMNQRTFNTSTLSINNTISFEYKSSYDNCNLIASEKLINNKSFQEKLRKFLKGEVFKLTNYSSNRYDSNQKESSNTRQQSFVYKTEKGISNSLSVRNSPNQSKNNNKSKLKIFNVFDSRSESTTLKKKGILRTSSARDNKLLNNKIKYKYDMEPNVDFKANSIIHSPRIHRNKKLFKNRFFSRQDVTSFTKGDSFIKYAKNKKSARRVSFKNTAMSPNFKLRKRKNNLLSQIDLNIEKTNQNLNNPEEFYSNYFNYLLEEKMNCSGYFGEKEDNNGPNIEREKTIKKGNTQRKIV